MEGEDGESNDPGSFQSKPLWKRILIVAAGSLMNLIVGVIVLAILFAPATAWNVPTVTQISDVFPTNGEQGLQVGDTITKIDGYTIYLFNDVYMGLERGGDDQNRYDLEVKRDGKKVKLEDVQFELKNMVVDGQEVQRYGLSFGVEESTFLNKTKFVLLNACNLVRMVKVGLVDLFTGNASVDDLAGPLGIGQIMVDTAKSSMPNLWFLVAFISINLGIMNLLPLPALDGGRLLFLLIELVRRKPVNPKYEAYVHAAGIILLMLLMVFVTFNDILRIFVK